MKVRVMTHVLKQNNVGSYAQVIIIIAIYSMMVDEKILFVHRF